MADQRKKLGDQGEQEARTYLENNGYRILDTNYENDEGEIDLIAYEPSSGVFVFVEVRTRSGGLFRPEQSVDKCKRKKLQQTANRFLARRDALGVPHRIDVIGVVIPEDGEADLRHHRSICSR